MIYDVMTLQRATLESERGGRLVIPCKCLCYWPLPNEDYDDMTALRATMRLSNHRRRGSAYLCLRSRDVRLQMLQSTRTHPR